MQFFRSFLFVFICTMPFRLTASFEIENPSIDNYYGKTDEIIYDSASSPRKPQTLEDRLQKHIKFDPIGVNLVGHITIDDHASGINQSTWLYVKAALDYYKTKQPIFIILELNTPGGEVFSAQEISDALKDIDSQYNIPVVAFVNNWAISAGAMLAYSTRFITIVKDASMGAAEPVLTSSEGKMETASEKINSALRTDFANRAAYFDRNPLIAEAMVDKDLILVLRQGKIIKLDNENQIKAEEPDPDLIITPKGKLLTLNAEQMMKYGVADILLLPEKLALITSQEQASGKWPASKMLLFQQPFFKDIPQATIDSYQMDWKTQFFVFLAHPVVSSILFLGLLIGFYTEMNTPGFGLGGTVAAICLFLIIMSSFSLQLAGWLELIMLFAGLGIILIEIFVLPTFGLLGIFGILLFIVGAFSMLLPSISTVSFDFNTLTFNAAGEMFMSRLAWLTGTFIVGLIIIVLMARYLMPHFKPFHRFVLQGEQEGFIAGENPSLLPQPGTKGEVLSTLRPSGKVVINDKVYDVVSEGGYIEKGEKIVVIRLEGSILVVGKL